MKSVNVAKKSLTRKQNHSRFVVAPFQMSFGGLPFFIGLAQSYIDIYCNIKLSTLTSTVKINCTIPVIPAFLEIFPQKHIFLWKYLSNEMPKVIEFRKKWLVSCLARLSSFRHFPSTYFKQKVPISQLCSLSIILQNLIWWLPKDLSLFIERESFCLKTRRGLKRRAHCGERCGNCFWIHFWVDLFDLYALSWSWQLRHF